MKLLYRQLRPLLLKQILENNQTKIRQVANIWLCTRKDVNKNIQRTTTPLAPSVPTGFSKRHRSTESHMEGAQSSNTAARLAPLNELSDEEQMIRDAAKRFCEEQITPLSKQMDETSSIPRDLIQGLFDNGFMCITVPQRYGGAGASFRAMTEAIYEICKADMGVGTLAIVHNCLVCRNLTALATEEQKNLYFPRLTTSEVASFCISEDIAGSDAYALRTTATRDGSDFILNGSKMWISNADVASIFLVFANVDPSQGYRGITLFVVERDTPGFSVGKKIEKLGLRSSGTAPVYLDNVRVPAENVIGEVGKAYKYALEKLADGRICAGVQGVAVSTAALEYTMGYLNERKQFGKRIWEFQAIQHQVCDALTRLEGSKLLVNNSIRRLEAGLPYTKEACMAKYSGTETCRHITSRCIEWMGGVGFTKDYPVEKYYRDAPIGLIYEGTSNIQLNTIAKFWESENFHLD